MDNLKKVGLTALGTVLVAGQAHAVTVGATAATSITFLGQDNGDDGNGWSMTDSVTFSASGEMDNGFTISTKLELEGSNTAAGTSSIDTRNIVIDTGDMGKLTFSGDGSSGPVGSWDDMTPSANEEAHGVTINGTVKGPTNAATTKNIFIYDYTIMDGLSFKASYAPSNGATALDSSMDYGLMSENQLMEGLTLYAAMGENNNAANSVDNTIFGVKYATDMGFTIGYQVNESDSQAASSDEDFTAIGVSYAVSDDLSISYNMSEIDLEGSTENQEATGVSFSYTTGGLTISATHSQVDNVGNAAAADNTAYEVNFGFAF